MPPGREHGPKARYPAPRNANACGLYSGKNNVQQNARICNGKPFQVKSEQTSPYWDSVSLSFTQNVTTRLWRRHSDRLNRSLLQSWIGNRQPASILKTDAFDEAVGEGLYPFLHKHDAEVHGIDIAPEAVNQAVKRYPDFDVRCGDVRNLPCADSSFDLVVSNSTLDHFQTTADIDQALRELYRVLKSGGELIISMDNLQNPIIAIRSVLPFGLLKKLHLVPYFVGLTFGRRGLVAALNRAGFNVIETKAILHCPRFLAVPLAGILQQRAKSGTRQKFLAFLAGFEVLGRLPTRFFTGHYVAARAVKP